MAEDRLFVVTGGPGSGKSTLVAALAERGFATAPEAGRAIIRDQLAIGGTALPWSDRQAFAERMLGWDLRSHRAALDGDGPVFFDRGVPDIVGYLRLCGLPVPPHVDKAARTFRYARQVFIAPPWPAIFRQDAERRQTPEEAGATCRAMAETYAAYGYDLVALPLVPVADRVRFVMDSIG